MTDTLRFWQQAVQQTSGFNIAAIGTMFGILLAVLHGSFKLGKLANAVEALVPTVKAIADTLSNHGERIARLEGGKR